MKRWWIIVAAIIAVAAISYFVFVKKPAAKGVQYRFAAVTQGELVRTVNATGSLEAVTTVTVGSQVSGTIAGLYADFNDKVIKGQRLALLDTTFLATQVAEAEANMAKAKANENEARRALTRAESLATQKLISGVEFDQATTSFETAQANVSGARAALTRAKTNFAYARINSPIEGTVISRNIDVGQTVAASFSSPTLFTIAQDLAKMRLMASVDEADVGQIAAGNPVIFTVDAFPEMVFKGDVEQVRIAPQVTSNVVTYTVVISVDNKAGKLMPGMTATVTIETARSSDILKVSSAATRFRPPSDRPAAAQGNRQQGAQKKSVTPREPGAASRASVYVMVNKKLEKKPVKVGLTTSSEVEIIEGLSLGDSVAIGLVSTAEQSSAKTSNPLNPMSGGGRGPR